MIDFSPLDKLKRDSLSKLPINAIGMSLAFIALHFSIGLPGAFQLLTLPVLVVFIWCISLVVQAYRFFKQEGPRNDIAYQEFAVKNNLSYNPANPTFFVGTGSLFTYGHSPEVSTIFTGTHRDLPVSLFHYMYLTGSGKNQTTYNVAVMRFTLPRALPQMVIDSHLDGGLSNGSVLPITFDASQRITAEGDFSKYFALYAPSSYAVSLLSIIGPDVMQVLLEQASGCDIEIIDQYVYFYWPFVPDSRAEYETMFTTADAVLQEVQRKLVSGNIDTSDASARLHGVEASPQPHLQKKRFQVTKSELVLFAGIAIAFFVSSGGQFFGRLYIGLMLGFVVASIIHLFAGSIRAKRLRKQLDQRNHR